MESTDPPVFSACQRLDRYHEERAKLLGHEFDIEALWRVIYAADHLAQSAQGWDW